jgi:hypothetical protein
MFWPHKDIFRQQVFEKSSALCTLSNSALKVLISRHLTTKILSEFFVSPVQSSRIFLIYLRRANISTPRPVLVSEI